MRKSSWTPSIVPNGDDQTIYIVLDDFGRHGQCYRETDVEQADLETVIQNLLAGEYSDPIRVVSFNTAERWSQDVSEDVAQELRRRCDLQGRDVPFFCRTSSISTKADTTIFSSPCRCHWSEQWRFSPRSPRRLALRRPSLASSSRRLRPRLRGW
jgi:hypothetical protein